MCCVSVLRNVSSHLLHAVRGVSYDLLCGVPYTALPLATLMSVSRSIPMLLRRKEGAKTYGTKQAIEGEWIEGQRCLIVEDVITTGASIHETIQPIRHCGMQVQDIVVLLNREQGGKEKIEAQGMRLHAVLTISQVTQILEKHGKITKETAEKMMNFVQHNQIEVEQKVNSTTHSMTH